LIPHKNGIVEQSIIMGYGINTLCFTIESPVHFLFSMIPSKHDLLERVVNVKVASGKEFSLSFLHRQPSQISSSMRRLSTRP